MKNILELLKNKSRYSDIFSKIYVCFVSFVTLLITSSNVFAQCAGTAKAVLDAKNDTEPLWYSEPLKQFFIVADLIGKGAYDALAGNNFMTMIIGLGFAFWLAFEVIKYVSPLYPQDPGDFFMSLGMGLFRCIFAVALLEMGGKELFEWTIGMFVSAAGNVGSKIISKDLGVEISPSTEIGIMGVYDSVKDLAELAGRQFKIAAAYGSTIFGYGLSGGIFCFPDIEPFFTGAILYIFSLIFLILIPLKLVDIALRLALLYAMLPLFIAAWAFPQTKKYVKVAWGMVMYIVFFLLIMSVLVSISAVIISGALTSKFIDVTDNTTAKEIFLDFKAGMPSFFIFLGAVFVAIKAFGTTSELTGFVSGGAGGGLAESTFGKAIAGVAGAVGAAGLALARQGGRAVRDAGGKLKGAKNWLGEKKAERNAVLASREGAAGRSFKAALGDNSRTASVIGGKPKASPGVFMSAVHRGDEFTSNMILAKLAGIDGNGDDEKKEGSPERKKPGSSVGKEGAMKGEATQIGGPDWSTVTGELDNKVEEYADIKTMVSEKIATLEENTVENIVRSMNVSTDEYLKAEELKKALIIEAVIRRKEKELENLENPISRSKLEEDIRQEKRMLEEMSKRDGVNYSDVISRIKDNEIIKEYTKEIDATLDKAYELEAMVLAGAAAMPLGGTDGYVYPDDYHTHVEKERRERDSEKENIDKSTADQEAKIASLRRQLDKEMDKGMRLREKLEKKGGEATAPGRYYSYDGVKREERKKFIFLKKKVTTIDAEGEHYIITRGGKRKIDKAATETSDSKADSVTSKEKKDEEQDSSNTSAKKSSPKKDISQDDGDKTRKKKRNDNSTSEEFRKSEDNPEQGKTSDNTGEQETGQTEPLTEAEEDK